MTEYFISYYDCNISEELSLLKNKTKISPDLCCSEGPCPQRLGACEHWILSYRCRLGNLTDREFEYFKQRIDENNAQPFHGNMNIDTPHYILHNIHDIPIDSLAARAEHIRAREKFERLPDWDYQRQCTKIMGRLQDVADDVRALQQYTGAPAICPTEQEIIFYRIEAAILKKFTRIKMRAVARKKARLSERLQKWQEKLTELDSGEAGLREDYEMALKSLPIVPPVKKKLIQPTRAQAVSISSDKDDSAVPAKPESPLSAIPCSDVDSKPSPDGSWRTAREYASHMGKKMKTIQDWRYKGTKAEDSMSGTDSKGTFWKRDRCNHTRILYWLEHR